MGKQSCDACAVNNAQSRCSRCSRALCRVCHGVGCSMCPCLSSVRVCVACDTELRRVAYFEKQLLPILKVRRG